MVLSAILALSAAAPSGLYSGFASPYAYGPLLKTYAPQPIYTGYSSTVLKPSLGLAEYHVPTVAKVGDIVQHVPTSVSHQSSSVVHNTGTIVTPVVTPVHKTIVAAPVLKTVHAPIAYSAPLWNEPLISSW